MEPHESQHIIQNISKLVEYTNVNTTLLVELIQAEVISNEEKDSLMDHSNPQARSLKLYQLLQTRECYSKLRAALETTKQSGALRILNKMSKVKNPSVLTKKASIPDNHCIAKNIYKGEMESRIKKYDHISDDNMKEFHNSAWKETEMLCLETNVLEEHELETIEQKIYEVFRTTEWHDISDNPPILSEYFTPTIGIDLGTKNCVVGFYTDTEEKVKIIEFLSQKSFASYVSFENNDQYVIGDIAKRCSYENPENTIFDSKRLLGRSKSDIETDTNLKFPFKINFVQKKPYIYTRGREYRPEQISALLLKHCKEAAESILKRKVTKAVVTVPAYFNDHQRVATLEAGKIAGLEVLHLLNEPVAAVIAYKQQRVRKFATRVLVFDVGGGTFDVAVIELQDKFIEVKSVGGNAFLGGEDIDNDLANYCLDMFSTKHKKDILDPKKNKYAARNYALLKEACEQVKKDLSSRETSCVSIPNFYKGEDLKVLISRDTFNSIIAPMIRQMIEIVQNTLIKGNTRIKDIEDILLVGGTTYIPKLRSELTKLFNGKRMCNDINPDTAVAFGAAVKAAILTSQSGRQHFNLQVRDVIPMSIGVEAIVRGRPDIFHTIIPSNSKYPCQFKHPYETSFDYQEMVTINIYQGENRIAKDNTHLGVFELRGIPQKKRGEEEIYVHMAINHLGVLVVTASCSSGSKSLIVEKIMTQ